MKKYLITIACIFAISGILFGISFAKKSNQVTETVEQRANEGLIVTDQRVFDQADLLSEADETKLQEKIESTRSETHTDIVVLTTNDAEGKSSMAYADDFYDVHDFGYEDSHGTGILFLIDMDNRQIYMATQGQAMNYYDDYRINKVLDNCYNHITDGDYKGTCDAFLKGVRDYMGRSTDRSARMDAFGVLLRLIIAIVIGAVVTFAMVFRRGGRVTTNSRTYFDASGSHLDAKEDRFMNRTVTRRHIEKPKGGGGSGGSGGGGVHMSSGGGTHGGGGRSF